ncbi:hypothetical protein FSP39_007731 [Pinctada imbricata]|uniref:CABIT domain-containing protein n=1 Tax=Pinctada imbricata TaxID=66713 RepID=A0AA88XQS2_PINIB|nr:hypothetical protein FSP39_007731 [Pinctada imbricata]
MESDDNNNLELQFEDGDLSLWEVLRAYPLPVVVQCDTAHCPIPMDRSRFNFDLSQPLLLYRKKEYTKGWFSVLKRNFHNGPIDDLVPHFQEVSEIADSPTETFLIGGDKKVQALQVSTKENGHLVHQQRTLFPGDVLRKGKLYIGEKKRKSKILRKTKVVTEKYLMCTDDSDREILLPFDQKGLFYTLTSNSGNVLRPVMQMSQIVAKKYPPCIARLVYGRIPNTPCSFSGTLRLDRSDLEQSVIAATIVNKRNILLEIPTTCNLKFKVAVTNESLIQNAGYKNSLEICNEKATIYMRHMKVCHTIEPDSHCVEIKFNPQVAENTESDVKLTEDTAKVKETGDGQTELLTVTRGSLVSNRVSSTDDGISSKTSSGSDYFEMRSIKGESICENVVRDSMNSVDSASSRSSPDYADMEKLPLPSFLKIGVENSFLTVSVSERRTKGLHESDPPNVPPPPPPSDSNQNYASVVKDADAGNRRPSTVTFCEGKHFFEDNLMYDIPRRTRRDSAPPELGQKSGPNLSQQMKQDFMRRPSSAMPLPKCGTLPSRLRDCVQEPLHEHHEDAEWSQDEADLIPEYNSDEEFGTPDYENLVGMVKVHDDLTTIGKRKMGGLPALPSPKPRRSTTDKLLNRESEQMSPQKIAELLVPKNLASSIGPIPALPRSWNSPRASTMEPELEQVFINTNSSLLDIPALPVSKSRSASPCIENQNNSQDNCSATANSEHENLDENANSTIEMEQKDPTEDTTDLVHEDEQNFTEELETEQCFETNEDLEDNEEETDDECSQSDSNVEDYDDYQNVANFSNLEIHNDSTLKPDNTELDDVISSEQDFGCIPDGLIHRGSSDRYSLHSDKSIATTSMDSGIVSRDPSVFGSKNSDLHMRNSQELESYDNWKSAGFVSSHVEGRDTPSDIVVGSPAGASFEMNDSFSDGSFSHDQSLESEQIGVSSPPGKDIRLGTPIKRSKIRRTKSRESKDISKMSTDELTKEFRRLGIKPETLQSIKDDNLNGLVLLEKYASIETVQELFPRAGLIEQQKISLYIKGCKY